jgi:predicted nucleic acid-binding protein
VPEKIQKNKKRILVGDTSAMISLEVGDVLIDSLERFEYVIPNKVCKEIEDISEINDEHGSAAEKILQLIKNDKIHRTSVKNIDKVNEIMDLYKKIDFGEAEALVLAWENHHEILITDDLRSMKDLMDISQGVRIHLSIYVIASMVMLESMTKKEALESLSRISKGRSWENSAIYNKAMDYIKDL